MSVSHILYNRRMLYLVDFIFERLMHIHIPPIVTKLLYAAAHDLLNVVNQCYSPKSRSKALSLLGGTLN